MVVVSETPATNDEPTIVRPHVPSIHVRAALTWLAIFPLVGLGMFVLEGLAHGWPPLLRAFVLTLVVVPLSVYVVVPALLRLYGAIHRAVRAGRRRD